MPENRTSGLKLTRALTGTPPRVAALPLALVEIKALLILMNAPHRSETSHRNRF